MNDTAALSQPLSWTSERRRAPRARLRLAVRIFVGGQFCSAKTVDINQFGVRLEFGAMGASNTILRFDAGDGPIRIAARRIRTQSYEFVCPGDRECERLGQLLRHAIREATHRCDLRALQILPRGTVTSVLAGALLCGGATSVHAPFSVPTHKTDRYTPRTQTLAKTLACP